MWTDLAAGEGSSRQAGVRRAWGQLFKDSGHPLFTGAGTT